MTSNWWGQTSTGPYTYTNGSASRLTYNLRVPPEPPMNQDPMLQGTGPVVCSSEVALSVRPLYVYDVNGYYRSLGVDPQSRPTKRDLRIAYHEVDGSSSEFATYAMQQLCDPVVRDEYDNMPFGSTFFDRFEEERLRALARAEAMRRMAAQGQAPDDVDAEREHLESIFGDMGIKVEFDDPDDADEDPLALEPPTGQDVPARPAKFEYAYYLWRTRVRSEDELLVLIDWQSLLAKAFANQGVRHQFAVGLHGREPRFMLARVGYREVLFLGRGVEPDADLAERAVSTWIAERPR